MERSIQSKLVERKTTQKKGRLLYLYMLLVKVIRTLFSMHRDNITNLTTCLKSLYNMRPRYYLYHICWLLYHSVVYLCVFFPFFFSFSAEKILREQFFSVVLIMSLKNIKNKNASPQTNLPQWGPAEDELIFTDRVSSGLSSHLTPIPLTTTATCPH